MICPLCHGNRVVVIEISSPQVCPHCQGQGTVYCCEGEQVQPDIVLLDQSVRLVLYPIRIQEAVRQLQCLGIKDSLLC
jgi:hypothetical protein